MVLAGDPAPGGGTFGSVELPKLNIQTQVGFVGQVQDGYGIFLASPSDVRSSDPLREAN